MHSKITMSYDITAFSYRMEGFTLLLSAVLFVVLIYIFVRRDSKRSNFEALVDQIPGPKKYPIIGTVLPFLFLKRNGKLCQQTLLMR